MKIKLQIILLFLLSSTSYASHILGEEITTRNTGGLTYEVKLTVYRDANSIISLADAWIYYVYPNATSFHNIIPLPPAVNIGNGVEVYTFIDQVTFPSSGTYQIYYNDCCRYSGILNGGAGEGFYVSNTLLVDSINSSPVFLNSPITIAQEAVPFYYNPLPFDADGDSLTWALDTPQTLDYIGGIDTLLNVSNYIMPFADSTMPFTMNPLTGEISFLPNTQGHFIASVLVSEYRAGIKIGEIRRDMQIIVVVGPNAPLGFSETCNTYPFTGRSYDILKNSNFTLTVTGSDPDSAIGTVRADGAPFLMANPATFSFFQSLESATGIFTWSPLASLVRTLPYLMSMRFTEQYGIYTFEYDLTYSLRVVDYIGIEQFVKNVPGCKIFPNPNTGSFVLQLQIEKTCTVIYRLCNLIGQEIAVKKVKLNEGVNMIEVDSHLSPNNYILSVEQENKVIAVKEFEVMK